MATQIAELISGGVHVIRTVPPDQIDYINNSGAAYVTSALACHAHDHRDGDALREGGWNHARGGLR